MNQSFDSYILMFKFLVRAAFFSFLRCYNKLEADPFHRIILTEIYLPFSNQVISPQTQRKPKIEQKFNIYQIGSELHTLLQAILLAYLVD